MHPAHDAGMAHSSAVVFARANIRLQVALRDDKQDLSVSRQLAGTHGPRRANPTFGWSHAGPDPLPDERRPTSSRSGGQRSPASTENGLMNGSLIGERGCDEAGQTFVEYAVLLVAIAGLVVAGWASIDGAITTAIGNVISAF